MLQVLFERRPIDIFHGEVRMPALGPRAIEMSDVRMAEARGRFDQEGRDGEKLKNAYGKQLNVYQEKTAKACLDMLASGVKIIKTSEELNKRFLATYDEIQNANAAKDWPTMKSIP